MSLTNFSLPYQLATPSPYVFTGTHGHQSTISSLRLNAVLPPPPDPSFANDHSFQNEPYIPPAHYQHQQQRQRDQQFRGQESYSGQQHQQHQQPLEPPKQQQQQHQHHGTVVSSSFSSSGQNTRYSNYNQDFRRTQPRQQQIPQQQQQQQHQQQHQNQHQHQHHQSQARTSIANDPHHSQPPRLPYPQDQDHQDPDNVQSNGQNSNSRNDGPDNYPERPGDGYTRVNGGANGSPGSKTSVHAILDYDDDDDVNVEDYYDDDNAEMPKDTRVTPIQGPIFLKNGSVPVVPLYSYPQLNNGTFVQIPILWTALSVALGVELRGDLVRGTPCIKRNHQLFCPTAGKTYPTERIEQFIDENKALMKRMYGDFETDDDYGSPTREPGARKRRNANKHDLPDGGPSLRDDGHDDRPEQRRRRSDSKVVEGGDSFFSKVRNSRQTFGNNRGNESGRVDACESKVEIVTPYWASNSAGKIRAIVNTQHFEQAIHQEVCSKTQTNRCTGDCGCEQKYKWHRLLAYDPDNDCKGIFMDWFLFPSCCVCRCDPTPRKFPATTSRN